MKRYAMTVMLKDGPEMIGQYEKLHADPWPEVLQAGHDCGIERLFIYRYGRQLFMFFETIDDFDPDRVMAKFQADAKLREWDEITRAMQEPVPGAPSHVTWVHMKEVHAVEDGQLLS